ncbi:MAG: glycosyltransferase [Bacteroidota bacterium]
MDNPKRILLAPLNWGLGHATRCIPIIRALHAAGAQVLLASDGAALRLLEKEFPQLPLFELPSYGIRYPGENMVWNMARQLPRLLRAVYREHRALARLVEEWKIDVVISDNRYGCWHPRTHNIILTHQLHLKVPSLLRWGSQYFNHYQLGRFDECWVPDVAGNPNLAGTLAHPPLPHCHYLGLLSRMQYRESPQRYDVAIVLSGPEPQRSLLEQQIITQIEASPHRERILLVQGRPDREVHRRTERYELVSYLTSRELNEVLLSTGLVVCRSGYSSLMDLAQVGGPALLIPTPGQTEQEYLAQHLLDQGVFYTVTQGELVWDRDVVRAREYPGFALGAFGGGGLRARIAAVLEPRGPRQRG